MHTNPPHTHTQTSRGTNWHQYLRFTWQAWHITWHLPSFCTWDMVLGGALGPGLGHTQHTPWFHVARGTNWHLPSFCVARGTHGTGFGHAWGTAHTLRGRRGTTLTSTLVSRGRRGTNWHLPSFCVARGRWYWVAPWAGTPGAPHFAWQAWHNLTSTFVSRGRRGTNWHLPSFCVAGVGQMVLGGALGPGFGAWGAAPLCVAGVAQPHIHLGFTWQAWHKLTSAVVLRGRRGTDGTGWRPWAGIWRLGRRATLRGRRGTTSHPPSFHVAGVAQTDICRRFAWQAWDRWYWVAPLGRDLAPGAPRHFAWQAWHNLTSTLVSRGRRGTNWHLPSFCVAGVGQMVLGGALGPGFGAWGAAPLCVAGVAQPHIHLGFTWQAWHKLTSAIVLRGRRGTDGTGWRPWAGIWRLGRRATLRGRRGTTSHPPSFHVAGVAQTDICRRFAWQAWDRWYWVAPLGRDLAPGAPRHFAWQAWHNLTSTFVSRGRRGTNWHLPSFCVAGVRQMVLGGALGPGFGAWGAAPLCVAGVAQPHIHLGFTWQAWHKLTSAVVLRGRRGTNWHLPWFCVVGVPLIVLGGAFGPGCGPSGMCLLSSCLGMFAVVERQAWTAATLCSADRHDRCCFLHANFHHVVLFWLLWPNETLQTTALARMACLILGMFKFGHLHAKMRSFQHVSSFPCFGMFKFGHLHAKMRSFRHVSSFRGRRHVWFWHVEVLSSSVGLLRASACFILAWLSFVVCMQRCGPSGMFLRSACFGMFDFGMFNIFLLSACYIPHAHTLPARCCFCPWSRGRAQLRWSNAVRRRHDRCWLHSTYTHTHTSGQVLFLLVVERQGWTARHLWLSLSSSYNTIQTAF